MAWCQVHSGICEQILFSVWKLLCCLCGVPSLTRGQSCLGVKFTLELVNRYYFLCESCCVVSVGPQSYSPITQSRQLPLYGVGGHDRIQGRRSGNSSSSSRSTWRLNSMVAGCGAWHRTPGWTRLWYWRQTHTLLVGTALQSVSSDAVFRTRCVSRFLAM
jgi:hypothetical protein